MGEGGCYILNTSRYSISFWSKEPDEIRDQGAITHQKNCSPDFGKALCPAISGVKGAPWLGLVNRSHEGHRQPIV